MYVGARHVSPLPGFKLLILFENGERRIFDVSSYLDRGVFRGLKDEAVFNSAHISFDSVAWANGADLCPEVLYSRSVPAGDRQP
jgi:hypothetical protein